MNDKKWTPFINWGQYKSRDPKKPDVLDVQISDLELFQTTYTLNARVNHKDSYGQWHERNLPIKSNDSKNFGLLKLWEEAFHKGWLRLNGHVRIKTWFEKSKRNKDRKIRRYKLIILD